VSRRALLVALLLGVFGSYSLQPNDVGVDMILEHNLIRENSGRPALVIDQELMKRAQEHSERMASRSRLFHSNIKPDEAENIAAGHNLTVTSAIKEWLRSPGHRRNIFGPYTKIGWGVSKRGNVYYYTVIFK
jgi:uncharacterized protein YkwD